MTGSNSFLSKTLFKFFWFDQDEYTHTEKYLPVLLVKVIKRPLLRGFKVYLKLEKFSIWKVNWLQSYKLPKLEDDPIVQESNPGRTRVVRGGPGGRIFFKPPTLTACNFDTSCPTETHSTSLKRSQPPQQTQSKLRGLKGFWIQSMLCQRDLIYIGLMF